VEMLEVLAGPKRNGLSKAGPEWRYVVSWRQTC